MKTDQKNLFLNLKVTLYIYIYYIIYMKIIDSSYSTYKDKIRDHILLLHQNNYSWKA